MSPPTASRPIGEPELPWDGPHPYEAIAARLSGTGRSGGALVNATAQEINDLGFDLLLAGELSDSDRLLWDSLRLVEKRLLVDFLMYEVGPPIVEDLQTALDGWSAFGREELEALLDIGLDAQKLLAPVREDEADSGKRPGLAPGPAASRGLLSLEGPDPGETMRARHDHPR